METVENKGIEVVVLFLQKLENLTNEERRVLIKTIDILNHPVFITNN